MALSFKKLIIIYCFSLPFLCQKSFSQQNPNSHVVVIDAGHGGDDPGAVYGGVREKVINLNVAKLLGEKIKKALPSAKIIYTRGDDTYIELSKRSLIANNAHADIFISLHCNASKNTQASGSETFVMGVDKTGANLEVAMKENSVIEMEEDNAQTYGGYDPNSAESVIIFSLMQFNYQTQSLIYAGQIQKELTASTSLRNRGVKQAGFLVLWRTAMPSVLCEMGFLSNSTDRAFLSSSIGQDKIAQSLSDATVAFLREHRDEEDFVAHPHGGNTPTREDANEESYGAKEIEGSANKPQSAVNEGIHYRVQVASTSTQKDINRENFYNWAPQIKEQKVGKLYKYSLGNAKTYKDALTLQRKLKKDFNDCFIVAFDGMKQITLQQAKELLEK